VVHRLLLSRRLRWSPSFFDNSVAVRVASQEQAHGQRSVGNVSCRDFSA
jgi:hypothetical protein